ncbi:diguanylate cyclase [Thalassotalea sp. PP2-459]|uniref:GGDEF domain-containing protein n=1 Tax=Thalassotalea sp. PP2-459 TaxID=1742724 RepID=UPI0009F927E4|nr:diguanylate cyclase [Thalassotalea sp. PP2-459]
MKKISFLAFTKFLLLSLFLLSSPLTASTSIALDSKSAHQIADKQLWRKVPTGITDVNKQNIEQLWHESLIVDGSIVGQSGGYLAKLNITNRQNTVWFLVVNANFIDQGLAYWQPIDKGIVTFGDFSQLNNRNTPQLLHFQAIPLQLAKQESGTLWLYITAKHFPTPASLTIYDTSSFYWYQSINNTVTLVTITAMLLLGILALLIYLGTRHRVAITCAGYVGLHGIGWLAASGLFEDIFIGSHNNWSYAGMYIFPFAIACASQFVADLFECKAKHNSLYKFLNLITAVCFSLGLVMVFLPFQLSFYLAHILAFGWIILTISVSCKMLTKHDFRAKYFLIGNVLYSLSLIYFTAAHSRYFGSLAYPEITVLVALSIDCICIVLSLSEWFKIKQSEFNRHFYLSRIDPLTQLGNRYALNETLNCLSECYFIVYIDFDGLKIINDKFGHEQGDLLIVNGARLISNLVVDKGKAFRTGGDEFICVFSHCSSESLPQLQDTVSQALEDISKTLKNTWKAAGLSFGTATHQEASTVSECLSLADKRMYQQKQQKK